MEQKKWGEERKEKGSSPQFTLLATPLMAGFEGNALGSKD